MSYIIEKKSIGEFIKESNLSDEDAAHLIYVTSKYKDSVLIDTVLEKAANHLTEGEKGALDCMSKEAKKKEEIERKKKIKESEEREKARKGSLLFSYRGRFSKEETAQGIFKFRQQEQQNKIKQQDGVIEDFSKLEESKNSSKEIKF